MENDDIFAKIKFLLFSWVPPSKISFRPLCTMVLELEPICVMRTTILLPIFNSMQF